MKKGDSVVTFSNWDSKGTFVYRAMRVESWGKVRATLRDEATGEMLKHAVGPHGRSRIFPVADFPTEESRVAKALELAAEANAQEREHYAECIERDGGRSPGYRAAMDKGLAEIHEPRAIEYNAAVAAIRARIYAQ
jgi:hypothetical protein